MRACAMVQETMCSLQQFDNAACRRAFLSMSVKTELTCLEPWRSEDGGMCLGLDLTVLKAEAREACQCGLVALCRPSRMRS